MSKIPTAEEFSKGVTHHLEIPKFAEVLKIFAKLHVQEALKAADNAAEIEVVDWETGFSELDLPTPIYGVNSKSIINAYPLENIQ